MSHQILLGSILRLGVKGHHGLQDRHPRSHRRRDRGRLRPREAASTIPPSPNGAAPPGFAGER